MKKNLYLSIIICCIALLQSCSSGTTTTSSVVKQTSTPEFVGGNTCTQCHEKEQKAWIGSHHEQAMKIANDSTVLGDFNDTSYEHFGVTYKFHKKDGDYYVLAESQKGVMTDYKILYTFGFTPLQQYIVNVDGKQQMLPVCWGSDPKKDEKDHWFHIYPDEKIVPKDMLHWTGNMQNWNYMCAECHSTKLRKNFDVASNSFNTTWSEINVSCEACHGPASNHNLWAKDSTKHTFPNKGLVYDLNEENVEWKWDLEKGTSFRSKPRTDFKQIEMCARCHSRRSQIWGDYKWGDELAQTHRVQLLNDPTYHPDGQILDEDYVYGSFIQSKMYQAGVTCSNCHDPHTTKVKTNSNALCFQCHTPQKYDTEAHHFHDTKQAGGSCLDCHMPTTNYMVTDPRRDHSIRSPRPDLSIKIGVPNACNQCHTDKDNTWSVNNMKKWYGTDWMKEHYGETMHEVRKQNPDALNKLLIHIDDKKLTPIVRATALGELRNYPLSAEFVQKTIAKYNSNSHSLIRREAASLLQLLPAQQRVESGAIFLTDDVRVVRLEAAIWLLNTPAENLAPDQQTLLSKGIEEYIASLELNTDRGESHTTIAQMHIQNGRLEDAEKEFAIAAKIDPTSVFIYLNWADLKRLKKDETAARELLKKSIGLRVEFAPAHLALGLSYVREKNIEKALESLKIADKYATDAHTGYIYGVALYSTSDKSQGFQQLESVHKKHPYDLEVLRGLISFASELKNSKKQELYQKKLNDVTSKLK